MLASLKTTIYARLEETSFRSGAAVSAGVLATAGAAIALAVVLGGHSDAAASAPGPAAATSSAASQVPAASPTANPRASHMTQAGVQPAAAASPSPSREDRARGNQPAAGTTPTPRVRRTPLPGSQGHGLMPGGWDPTPPSYPWRWGW